MTFRFTVNINPITLEFDSDTINSGNEVIEREFAEIERLIKSANQFSAMLPESQEVTVQAGATGVENQQPAKRTRRKKNEPDPAAASAPAPVAVPSETAPTPPTPVANNAAPPPVADGLAIPGFLDRTKDAAAPAASAPPPPAPAPAPAPAAPSTALATKLIDEIKKRAGGSAENEAAWVKWLADPANGHLVPEGATFDETVAVLQFATDDKIRPLLNSLGVAE